MALQIRRGTNNQRSSMPLALAQGELAFVTDSASQHVSPVWIGDGSTIGGIPVAPVVSVNGKTGQAVLTADDLATGTTNKYFTNALSHASTASLLTNATLSGLTITYNSGTDALTITNTNTINAATTANTLSYYAATGKTLSPTQSLTWNESTNYLQIVSGVMQSTTNIIGGPLFIADAYGTGANSNNIQIRRARGTNISPTTLVAGDLIGSYDFRIWDGTSWIVAGSISGATATTPAISTGVVQGIMNFILPDSTGAVSTRFKIGGNGVYVGPGTSADSGTGQLTIRQTTSSSNASSGPAIYVRNYYSDANPASIGLRKSRGTYATPAAVLNNDIIGEINANGNDGSGTTVPVGTIQMIVDGSVSTSIVPGSIILSTSNSSGILTRALKIDHTQSAIFAGSVVSTVAPGNYTFDVSSASSQITLSVGGTVAFPNFSGSVLVNCYNSGIVTQYLCGGGSTPIAIGSSNVTATGTMASTIGIAGYTFTATQAGIHSFYVVRTRAGA